MSENYKTIPINHIFPGENIREVSGETNKKTIEEMTASLKQSGQLQPIQVYEEGDGNYKVLIGFCRYFGAQLAKLPTMKCIIVEKPSSLTERVYIQATENEQKKSLSSEEREAYITMLMLLGKPSLISLIDLGNLHLLSHKPLRHVKTGYNLAKN